MQIDPIPIFCLPCIKHLRVQCPHLHTSFSGGWHFFDGEPWDDIHEVCDDCGVNLDKLSINSKLLTENIEPQF